MFPTTLKLFAWPVIVVRLDDASAKVLVDRILHRASLGSKSQFQSIEAHIDTLPL